MDSLFKESINFISWDLFGNILFFPIWWYTIGVKNAFRFSLCQIEEGEHYLALSVWMKNLFVPMYAQYDWQGRIISFFMRLMQIIIRSALMLCWIFINISLFLFWLILPLIVIFQISRNLVM